MIAVMQAGGSDSDGQGLLAGDAALREHVPVFKLLAGLPAVDFIRHYKGRINAVSEVAIGGHRRLG